jgi:ATP-dependent RNA helicase HelY
MSINLISQFGAERARTSLESSLAQFQADKAVVGLAKQIRKNENARDSLLNESKCELGNFHEYANLRHDIKRLESDGRKNRKKRQEIEEAIAQIRRAMKSHPCHPCPDRELHARVAERAFRLQREIDGLNERIEIRTNVIAKRFDRIRIILDKFGYLQNDQISTSGKMLAKIYAETDLLIAEAVRANVFADLTPPQLVSVISSCIYESRNDEAAKIPKGETQAALTVLSKIYGKLHDSEIEYNLEPMRAPDFGFCWAAFRWASGHSLTSILRGTELTVGDFVRSMKQIIDLLRQLKIAAPEMQNVVYEALLKIDRGVIAYSGATL